MTRVGHVMILASAGSGKTYALTNRFVRLLALGAAPERIVALTFTRKAAGEFFDEILNKLARAASDAAYARQLAAEIGRPAAMGTAEFLALLRRMVDAMHRLRLGTIDGFFARIARNFPLELGLAGEFELLEEHAARMERSRVLRQLFERPTDGLADAQREFIEAFKRATFGVEEKRLGAQLDAFLDEHQEIFLNASARDAWGDARRIWRNGSRWLGPPCDVAAAVQTLRAWVDAAGVGEKQRQRWMEFFDACVAWAPGIAPVRPLVYVLEKVLAAWSDLEAGRAVLEFDRKPQELSAAACAALAALARHVVGGELTRRLEMTSGIYAVLAGYEAMYHDAVRRAGKLTFADVQRLLMPGNGAPLLSGREAPGAVPDDDADSQLALPSMELGEAAALSGAEERRLLIDYRLDGEIDHWLLDEFQDTSFGQWSVLRNLIDEAVQDSSGARSFFYVGDVKQAIFAWREGDPRLFREIFDHYNAMRPGTIAEEHLVKSWRSGPAVIASVNRVFGAAAELTELFACPATQTWNREWRAHETARPQLAGHVALLHAGGPRDTAGISEEARFALTLALLEEIQPLARGLSCAVLVQKNSTATALADRLRRAGGIAAVAESDLHVCTDNPVGTALLALAKAAAHPGDTRAWEHVQMSPLASVLHAQHVRTPEQLTRRLLTEIHRDGFERTFGEWARRLEPRLASDDAFSRERLRQFAAAAGLFDATGSRDVAEFIAFMERHVVREVESADVVRVMTIHKAKGLGFDVVILPDLEGQKLDSRRDGLAVQRGPDRQVEWVLDLPGKLIHDCDTILAEHVRAAEADACYEALSLLYVAMTRAKRAMYLVVKPPGASSSRNYPRLLARTLGEETIPVRVGAREFAGAFSEGDPRWHLDLQPAIAADAATSVVRQRIEPLRSAAAKSPRRLVARRPSSVQGTQWMGAQLFSAARTDRTEFGTAVHRLLAEVEWGTPATAQSMTTEWRARGEDAAVVAEAAGCLESPALAHVWRSAANAEVWRERAFEIVLEDVWVSGIFDRVIVWRDAAGRPIRASVFDFKTDRVGESPQWDELARRHAGQLNLYRRVATVLTGLPAMAITSEAVFTRARRAVAVTDATPTQD
ncbi:UvrD-helicase domain-containing protein [Opitutus terrae]|uniref:DNA 3'-5' helicase n=1 Tax=Opitutus terrae (strain DSM 11246 / JCM 15787 / PB90-1) TaxID=452637 RepID=B1ZTI9_OPITP|nr:UvrD-helicase domain-containing protein [Opitutus terrae]ACB73934.1 UvrD/REP helicase [Opitutus terrae PB90-1]